MWSVLETIHDASAVFVNTDWLMLNVLRCQFTADFKGKVGCVG